MDHLATYDFLLVIHSNYGPILYHFHPAYLMHPLRELCLEFCNSSSAEKTRDILLSSGAKSLTKCAFV